MLKKKPCPMSRTPCQKRVQFLGDSRGEDDTGNDRETGGFCIVNFGTGSNTELAQNTQGSKYKMALVRPHIYKQKIP